MKPNLSAEMIKQMSEENALHAGLILHTFKAGHSVYATLALQLPGGPPAGRLVWQHRRPMPDATTEAVLLCADALARSAAYMDREGWPVVRMR